MRLSLCLVMLAAASARADGALDFRPSPCDPDPKVVQRIDAMALELAKKAAAPAEVAIAQGCLVVLGVAFVKFKPLEAEVGGVRFIVPLSVMGKAPVAKVKPAPKPAQWSLNWAMKPAALEPYAKQILAEPATALLGEDTVECLVQRGLPDPHVVGFLCGPAAREPNAITPSEVSLLTPGPRAVEFLLHEPKKGCDCPSFFLEQLRVPIALADRRVPGFCHLPSTSALKTKAAQRPPGWLLLTHQDGVREVVLEDAKGALREVERVPVATTTACQVLPACP